MEGVLRAACCVITPTGCSSRTSTSSSFRNVSSASPYGSHSSFREEAFGVQYPRRISRHQRQRLRAVADGSVPIPRRVRVTKEVVMVDPVEAKRLAAVEMEVLRAKQKLKKQRRIEAINGGFAVIGLTAGLVIEGYTGKSILDQIAGYIDGVADFLSGASVPITPSQEVLQEINSQLSSTQEFFQKIVNSQ